MLTPPRVLPTLEGFELINQRVGRLAPVRACGLQVFQLPFQICQCVVVVHTVRLEEAVDLITRLESEQPTEIRLVKTAGTIFIGHQRFKRAPFESGRVGAEAFGKIVGDADGQVHRDTLSRASGRINLAHDNHVRGRSVRGSAPLWEWSAVSKGTSTDGSS